MDDADLCGSHDVAACIHTRLLSMGRCMCGECFTATPIPGPDSADGTMRRHCRSRCCRGYWDGVPDVAGDSWGTSASLHCPSLAGKSLCRGLWTRGLGVNGGRMLCHFIVSFKRQADGCSMQPILHLPHAGVVALCILHLTMVMGRLLGDFVDLEARDVSPSVRSAKTCRSSFLRGGHVGAFTGWLPQMDNENRLHTTK